jgi:hypothetical protein
MTSKLDASEIFLVFVASVLRVGVSTTRSVYVVKRITVCASKRKWFAKGVEAMEHEIILALVTFVAGVIVGVHIGRPLITR